MGIIRTFVSYSSQDRERVDAVLRRVAPYGVRPWIDYKDADPGCSLSERFDRALAETSSMSLFLSRAAVTSAWIADEVMSSLPRVPAGRPIIPILLDPLESLALPKAFEDALRKRGDRFDTLASAPTNAGFEQAYARAVLRAGGAVGAREVVVHLGHRDPAWTPRLPTEWQRFPAVDVRLRYPETEETFSPTAAEWEEIWAGLQSLRGHLSDADTLRLSGRAPLGVAVMAGRTWNRGLHQRLEGWDLRNKVPWRSEDARTPAAWAPEAGGLRLRVTRTDGDVAAGGPRVTIALLPKLDQEATVVAWNRARTPATPLVIVRTPLDIDTPADAATVVKEAHGVISWLRTTHSHVQEIDLVLGLPFALSAILAHHVRQLGTIHFWDQVLPAGEVAYRRAHTWS